MAKHGLWMPMYWADYLADTQHFSTYQHGAYLLLIGAYWCRGGPLPADAASIARMTRSTQDKVARYLKPVLAMFTCKNDLLHHQRIDLELSKSCERIASASANANARWHAPAMLTTTTKEGLNTSYLVGKKNGLGNGVTIKDPANRLAIFQRTLAESIGKELRSVEQGWLIVGRAADPTLPEYSDAIAFCKAHAKQKLGKGWPHQWPKA